MANTRKTHRGPHPNGRKPPNPVPLTQRKYGHEPKSRGKLTISVGGLKVLLVIVIFTALMWKLLTV